MTLTRPNKMPALQATNKQQHRNRQECRFCQGSRVKYRGSRVQEKKKLFFVRSVPRRSEFSPADRLKLI